MKLRCLSFCLAGNGRGLKPANRRCITLLVIGSMAAASVAAGADKAPTEGGVPPPGWSSTGQSTVAASPGDLSVWWHQFGDPTLSGLIEQALKANPNVRTAQARLREARGQRNLASANRFPSIAASGSASGQETSGTTNGQATVLAGSTPAVAAAGTSYSASANASWNPDVFGGQRRALAAAQADLMATEDDLHTAEVSLVAEVAADYVALRANQTRLEIARHNEASQAETSQITQWRAQAGLVGGVDVEQALANLEQTRASIPTLEINIAQEEHGLAILLGLSPGALKQQLATSAPIPTVPDEVAVGIPAEALRQRPDVRAAEERVVAETARLAQTRTTRYPSFSLTGSIGAELVTGALTGGTSVLGSWSASVAQTIFDAGRIRQQIEIQNAVQERAIVTYESTVLTALQEVENALVSFEKSRQRLTALTSAGEAARNAALLARNRYSAGLVDFQTVLDTERTLLSLEDSVASTQGDRASALIQLYKALGGGWSSGAARATKGNHS